MLIAKIEISDSENEIRGRTEYAEGHLRGFYRIYAGHMEEGNVKNESNMSSLSGCVKGSFLYWVRKLNRGIGIQGQMSPALFS